MSMLICLKVIWYFQRAGGVNIPSLYGIMQLIKADNVSKALCYERKCQTIMMKGIIIFFKVFNQSGDVKPDAALPMFSSSLLSKVAY